MRGLAAIVFMTFAAIVAAALAFGSRAAPVAAPKFAQGTAIAVDTELVLAVDVSYSMDPDEQALQREGYITGLTSPEFLNGLRQGAHGKIAITYFEWAGATDQQIVVPWRLIDGPGAAFHPLASVSPWRHQVRRRGCAHAWRTLVRCFG